MPLPDSDVSARTDPSVEPIPAVLDAFAIGRILGISRPTAYEVLARCHPFKVGRLLRCTGDDFLAFIERQREEVA